MFNPPSARPFTADACYTGNSANRAVERFSFSIGDRVLGLSRALLIVQRGYNAAKMCSRRVIKLLSLPFWILTRCFGSCARDSLLSFGAAQTLKRTFNLVRLESLTY